MATRFNDILQWKILPISYIGLWFNHTDQGNSLFTIYNLQKGSSWNITEVTEPNDSGGETVQCGIFTGKFVLLQNNYEDMLTRLLNNIADNISLDLFYICLDAPTGQANGNKMYIGSSSSYDAQWSIKYTVEQNGMYPLLTLEVTGILPISKMISTSDPIFNQQWSSGYA